MKFDRFLIVHLLAPLLFAAGAGSLAAQDLETPSPFQLSLASLFGPPGGAEISAQAKPAGQPLAGPEGAAAPGPAEGRRIGVRAGLGFTADPGSILTSVLADYRVVPNLQVGPLLQFGVSGNTFLIAPTLQVQYTLPVTVHGAEQLKPFAQGGIGFVYIERERNGPNLYDSDFLINFGLGADYWLSDRVAVGNNFLFNFVPGKVLDEAFFLSWQFLTLRYNF